MHVALVVQKLHGITGGAERVLVGLANELHRRGHEVDVIIFDPAGSDSSYPLIGPRVVNLFSQLARRLLATKDSRSNRRRSELAEQRIKRTSAGVRATALWHLTHGQFARRLATWIRESRPDVVVGMMPPAISAVAYAGRRLPVATRPRLVASTHNVPDRDFGPDGRWDPNPVARDRNLRALRMVDQITVLSPDFVKQLPVEVQERTVVMPNPVATVPSTFDGERDDLIVGVGRLTDVKNYSLLIDSFSDVAERYPTWNLEIYGDGPLRSELNERVTRYGLNSRVKIHHATDRIGDVYQRAKILCHPAKYEGFGLVVAEAILHGLDVVAFADCTGVNELVEHGRTGQLVGTVPSRRAALSHAIRASISGPADRPGRGQSVDALGLRLEPTRIYDRWERLLSGSEPGDVYGA